MITVGLDFGTHQSKVCIEKKEGAELSYEFFMFKDADGKKQFTLPSIIHVDSSGHMTYGYLPNKLKRGKIIRYFKQATFTSVGNFPQTEAINYSIWYMAYILFELEEFLDKILPSRWVFLLMERAIENANSWPSEYC